VKTCPRCGEIKPRESFHKDARRPDGLRRNCIDCRAEEHAQRAAQTANVDIYELAASDSDFFGRVMARLEVQSDHDCWRWTGRLLNGYANVWFRDRTLIVHRLALVRATGSNRTDMHAAHLCHDEALTSGLCTGGDGCLHRACANPRHLEWQSSRDNALAGSTLTAANAAKTHCIRGHELLPGTRRNCPTCHRMRAAEQKQLIRAAASALGLTWTQYVAAHGESKRAAEKVLLAVTS
jgi:hypothetical protein